MSLRSHEEIGRVGRVGRGCYEKTALVEFTLYGALNILEQRSACKTCPSGNDESSEVTGNTATEYRTDVTLSYC